MRAKLANEYTYNVASPYLAAERGELDGIIQPHATRVSVIKALRALRGKRASIDGKWLHLDEASIAVSSPPPPVWIAAEQPRMLGLAARADGWNHAYWSGEDPSRFERALDAFEEELRRAGRAREAVEASASIACTIEGAPEAPDGFREPEVAAGSAAQLATIVRAFRDAGADHVILSLSPDPYAEIDEHALDKAAEILDLI